MAEPLRRRLLLSDATSYKAVVVAAFVKAHYPAVEVVTCDSREASSTFHTRHSDSHVVLRHGVGDGAGYVSDLLGLVRERAIDLLLPVNSREMELLIPQKALFGRALDYWGDEEALLELHRKDRVSALARECGVKTPELFADLGAIRLPAVAKPVASSSAKGVRYLRTPADVEAFRAENRGGHVVQEFVLGEGVGYSVFARGGQVLVGFGHRRLAEYPVSGGSSVYRESLSDPRLAEAARLLVERSGWSGFAMFEFKRTPAGELFLLEANPRLWGSIHQGLANGANFLEPLLGPAAVAAGGEVFTYFSPVAYLSFAAYLLHGNASPLLRFVSNLARNRADVALFRDPLGWAGSLLRVG